MATITRVLLSGSTSGRNQKVTGINSAAAITVHTTLASPTLDEIFLYALNTNDAADRILTIEWGGVTSPDDLIVVKIKKNSLGLILVLPGLMLTGTLLVKAFADVADEINLVGYVNRITP